MTNPKARITTAELLVAQTSAQANVGDIFTDAAEYEGQVHRAKNLRALNAILNGGLKEAPVLRGKLLVGAELVCDAAAFVDGLVQSEIAAEDLEVGGSDVLLLHDGTRFELSFYPSEEIEGGGTWVIRDALAFYSHLLGQA